MNNFVVWPLLAAVAALVVALGVHVTEPWRIGFTVAGALALGFGIAVVAYRRFLDSRVNGLAADYQDLVQRSQIIARQAERLERQGNIDRQMAAR